MKENIILGQLIPAGTGLRAYQDMVVTTYVGNIFGRAESSGDNQGDKGPLNPADLAAAIEQEMSLIDDGSVAMPDNK